MKRIIDDHLLLWKRALKRKPLVIRGARQVGKTFSVRKLGGAFDHFVEVNFEKDRRIASFFAGSLEPKNICEKLSAYYQIPVTPGNTLLFLDEIQACPDAIRSLRFFYEEFPELHVIAAGSLLEFALAEIPSHGVGRLTNLFMYPLSFDEFLNASGYEALSELIHTATPLKPLDNALHLKLLDILRVYLIIGGMPEVVAYYVEERNIMACQRILDDIILTMRDDFAKYRKRAPLGRLDEVLNAIPFQAGNKFKYASIDSNVKSAVYKDCLDMLLQAGLVEKINHTDARGIPLGGQIKPNKFKTILFDVGIQQRIQRNDITPFLMPHNDKDINRGGIAEAFVGTELVKYADPHIPALLYYWHREAKSSNAEVDYVIQAGMEIIPLEVKSGTKGQMQSLHLFLAERNLQKGIRLSLENFAEYGKISTIPLYAVSRII